MEVHDGYHWRIVPFNENIAFAPVLMPKIAPSSSRRIEWSIGHIVSNHTIIKPGRYRMRIGVEIWDNLGLQRQDGTLHDLVVEFYITNRML